jgi:hypothetical protein
MEITSGSFRKDGILLTLIVILLLTGWPVNLNAQNIVLLSAEAQPALIYGNNGALRQPVILKLTNESKVQSVDVLVDGKVSATVKLQPGENTVEINIPEVSKEQDLKLSVAQKSKELASLTLQAKPVKHWTLYMVQHTHTDIGYTKPQTEILTEHIRYIDYAIEFCEATENYPDDAKFRWVCEAAWAVREYIKNRPQSQVDKFIKYIKNGQIEVTGMFFNLSELVDENSFKVFFAPLREFKQLGIPVVSAMQNDVNGLAWCLADYLPELGIKYVSMGENQHRALKPFEIPTIYKWESPSGKSIYSYCADHYHTGNFWGIDRVDVPELAPKVFDYLRNLTTKNYPFDAVSVQYSGYHTDNSPPSMRESDLIRNWNKKYAWPKLRCALIHEFLDYVSSKYDAQLPVYRAAYPDWWTDGFGSAARETAATRKTNSDMLTIQGLLSMAALHGQNLPGHLPEEIRHVQENLLFYDEHTFGSAESISEPTCENSEVQWAEKSSYAWEGLKSAQMLYETSIGLLQPYIARESVPTVTFFNSLNWKRSGITELYIDHDIIPQDKVFGIVDETGKTLKAQLLRSRREGSYYAVYVEDIPPMGYKTFKILAGKEDSPQQPKVALDNYQIENEYYIITLDNQTGNVKSLYDKQLKLEIVDAQAPWQLGAFVYETLNNNRRQMEQYKLTEYDRKGLSDIKIEAGKNGAIYQSVHIRGQSAGCEAKSGVDIEIRLFHQEKRIELHYTMRKLPITEPDGIYVAFPFRLDNAKLYFDVQGGVVSPGENQLDGTASDWNTVQNFVTARNDKAQLIVGSNLIPLFQLGGINTGLFQRHKTYQAPHVYSWVTNNYWTTNFRASQEGELKWSYYLTSDSDLSNTLATRFGWNSRVPIYSRVMPSGKPNNLPSAYSAFSFDRDNLLMTSITPSSENGYLLLNVRELDGKATPLHIKDSTGKTRPFSVVNLIEEPVKSNVEEILFEPYSNKFIKIKL